MINGTDVLKLKGTIHLGSVDMIPQREFFKKLLNVLSPEKNLLKFNSCDETGNTFYWGLASNRIDIPDSLQITNQEIISYLLQ